MEQYGLPTNGSRVVRTRANDQVKVEPVKRAFELIDMKRAHAERLANQGAAAGEVDVLAQNSNFLARPKGSALALLMEALRETGVVIKKSSFDAIALPVGTVVDFANLSSIKAALSEMTFIEVKTANQQRVRVDFSGFFFAFTEGELTASEILGHRHRVMLLNKATGGMLLTSVPELLARARSTNWQVSIQL